MANIAQAIQISQWVTYRPAAYIFVGYTARAVLSLLTAAVVNNHAECCNSITVMLDGWQSSVVSRTLARNKLNCVVTLWRAPTSTYFRISSLFLSQRVYNQPLPTSFAVSLRCNLPIIRITVTVVGYHSGTQSPAISKQRPWIAGINRLTPLSTDRQWTSTLPLRSV